MTINWNEIMQSAITALIVVLVPVLAAWLSGLFASWRSKLAVEADDAWYEMAGKEAAAAVLATLQVLVDDAKAASADGKLTEKEKNAALEHAMRIASESIGDIPAHIRPKFDSWIKTRIEAAVGSLKLNKAAQQPTQIPTNGGAQTVAAADLQTR